MIESFFKCIKANRQSVGYHGNAHLLCRQIVYPNISGDTLMTPAPNSADPYLPTVDLFLPPLQTPTSPLQASLSEEL